MGVNPKIALTVVAALLAAGQGVRLQGAGTLVPAVSFESKETLALSARRVFSEPLHPIGRRPSPEENKALSKALDLFSNRGDAMWLEPIQAYLEQYPSSPWKASILLNIGTIMDWEGYPEQALASWRDAWEAARVGQDPDGVGDWVGAKYSMSLARLGKIKELRALLAEILDRPIHGRAASFVAEARYLLNEMVHHPERSFRCGPVALENLAGALGQGNQVQAGVDALEVGMDGTSMAQIMSWGKSFGIGIKGVKRETSSPIPVPSILQWRVGHFGTVVRQDGDQFLVMNYLGENKRWVSRKALESQVGPWGLIPEKMTMATGWDVTSTEDLASVKGTGNAPNGQDPDDPDDISPPSCPQGMPVYHLDPGQTSVRIKDIPLWYNPPFGPAVAFQITYNSTDINQPATFSYWNLGPKWTCDWLSYVTDDPANPGVNVTLYQRGWYPEIFWL